VDAYALVLNEAAAMRLAAATRAEQRQLALILDGVKAAPFRTGDLQERDVQGRINEVLVVGNWIVTYWPDHAVRELRVVRLEQVGD
jgi:hypothetical protein